MYNCLFSLDPLPFTTLRLLLDKGANIEAQTEVREYALFYYIQTHYFVFNFFSMDPLLFTMLHVVVI